MNGDDDWSGTNPFDDDKLREECGIFAVHGHKDAAALTALGLHALQHRGQEACGIVTSDGARFHSHRALGQVGDNFSSQRVIDALPGRLAIGHNRYATTGETILRNVQPLFAEFDFGGFALGHNGNLTNAASLRQLLVRQGCLFQSTTDTEVIHHLMARAHGDVETRLLSALNQVEGAYSLVAIASNRILGVRDPLGVRPLVLGRLDDAWILSSETCALDIIGARFEREIEPGELVVIDAAGVRATRPFGRATRQRFCVFEYVYFGRPDSVVEGISIYEARKSIGAELALESGVPADIVVPVPDSGVPAALGYAQAADLPFELGIIRNHYVGRTFIEPTDHIRHLGVKLKHNANRAKLAGKRVILVDDSIVRGTTSKKIVEMVRQAGATEVHMRISSPPTKHSCFYGIDTPEASQLLASKNDVAAMARIIGVDSLAFISIDGLYRAMGEPGRDPKAPRFCDACFTGEYPTRLTDIEERGDNPVQASLLEIA
jgi:amidophosphoribosyltransferase